jgi:MFS family permease
MGLQPFGAEKDTQLVVNHTHEDDAKVWEGIPLAILKKCPHFYMMLVVILFSNFANYVVYPTIVSHLQDGGMPLSSAAQIQSMMFMFLAAAKIFEGMLSDRFGARRVMVLCMGCFVISAVMLATVSTYRMAVLGVAIFSIAFAESTVMIPVLVEDVYGSYDRSAILGLFLAITRLASGLGPTAGNIAYDTMGSYTPIYYIMAVVSVGMLILLAIAVRGADREKERVTQEEARILNP